MSTALTSGGNVEILEKGFEKIFEKATDEQDERVRALMETFDWTKEGASEEFIESLAEIGIVLDESDESI
jgi:hypothetical protein